MSTLSLIDGNYRLQTVCRLREARIEGLGAIPMIATFMGRVPFDVGSISQRLLLNIDT
jgi:hypothetical protein